MSQAINNPFPMFFDRYGRPLTGGKVFIGASGADPEVNPISAFFDAALTQAASQPIDVIGGLLSNGGNPARVFVDEDSYSIRARDADGAEVFYISNAVLSVEQFQPLDSDLTAISALATTSFGRALLTQASGAALRSYAGIVDPIPLAGGSATGEVKRAGAGAYVYMANSAYGVARIYVTENGAPDPRTQIGDFWLEEEA